MLLKSVTSRIIRDFLSRIEKRTHEVIVDDKLSPEQVDSFTVKSLEERAGKFLLAGQIDAAANVFRELQSAQIQKGLVVRVVRDALMDPARGRAGTSYVSTLTDVELDTGHWVVLDGNNAYIKETYGRNFSKSPIVQKRVSPDQSQFIVAYHPSTVHVEEPCVLVGSDENYSHWLLRSLLKLWLVEREPGLNEHPWLLGENLYPFQQESLDLLGIKSQQRILVPHNAVIACRKIFVPTQMRGNQDFRNAAEWLRGKFRPFMAKAQTPTDRLFVSRKDAGHRFIVNEDELFASLSPLGFRRIELAHMSFQQQIFAFSKAKVIVAPHGAGLTNMIFSPPEAHIVEISSSNMLHMADFRWIAHKLSRRITTIVTSDYEMNEERKAQVREVNWDYRVSVEEVLKAVR